MGVGAGRRLIDPGLRHTLGHGYVTMVALAFALASAYAGAFAGRRLDREANNTE